VFILDRIMRIIDTFWPYFEQNTLKKIAKLLTKNDTFWRNPRINTVAHDLCETLVLLRI